MWTHNRFSEIACRARGRTHEHAERISGHPGLVLALQDTTNKLLQMFTQLRENHFLKENQLTCLDLQPCVSDPFQKLLSSCLQADPTMFRARTRNLDILPAAFCSQHNACLQCAKPKTNSGAEAQAIVTRSLIRQISRTIAPCTNLAL